MNAMPEQTFDKTVNDAALESVTAEVQTKPSKNGSPAEQKIAELESQLREAGERALRTQAELENYRKRMQREMADERKYADVPLARDLLPVVDNLERAIEAIQARAGSEGKVSGEVTSLLDGVKLVASQLEAVLKSHQCERIEAVGAAFDPNFHQALAQEPSEEHPAGTVSRSMQAGFKLHDRVIRPAQVFVSTGPAK
jgi:molecular chaperone GrpE